MPADDRAGGYGDLEANMAMAVVGLRSEAQSGAAELKSNTLGRTELMSGL